LFLIGNIDPNLPQRIRYVAPSGWSWLAPQLLALEPGGTLAQDISIETAERELRIVDSTTNLPRANQRIAWRTGADFAAEHDDAEALAKASATSDAQGMLRARLPLGQARFVAIPPAIVTPAIVNWTASNVPIVLRIE